MESPERYRSTLAFVDLLFNVLLGFVFLFVVAFVLINPVAKQADVIVPAEYMIVLTWPDDDVNDLDLWVKDPVGNTVNFMRREAGLMNLDRDDLGDSNDTVVVNGEVQTIELNREVVTLRGVIPGRYLVTVHLYARKDNSFHPIPATVEVIKLNPYAVVYKQTHEVSVHGQRQNFYQFSVNADGDYYGVADGLIGAMDNQ